MGRKQQQQQQQGKKVYSVPPSSVDEIRSVLEVLGLEVTAAQLSKPDGGVMRAVMDVFVQYSYGESREDMRTPQFGALDDVRFPELHEESIAETRMIMTYLRLCSDSGLEDVSINDFLEPVPKRARKIFSWIINLCKFREDCNGKFAELQAGSSKLESELVELEDAQAHKASEVAQLKARQEAERPEAEALAAETAELAAEIAESNAQHAAQKAEADAIKARIHEVDDRIAEAECALLQEKKQNAKLRMQVVKHPEKLKARIGEMHEELAAEKATTQELTKECRDLEAQQQRYEATGEKIQKRITNLDEYASSQQKLKALQKSTRELTLRADESQESARELNSEQQDLMRKMQAGRDRFLELRHQYEKRKHEAALSLDEVESQLLLARRKLEQEQQQAQANYALEENKRVQLERQRAEHERDMASLRDKYKGLVEDVRHYNATLLSVMEA